MNKLDLAGPPDHVPLQRVQWAGRPKRGILILHPSSQVWCRPRPAPSADKALSLSCRKGTLACGGSEVAGQMCWEQIASGMSARSSEADQLLSGWFLPSRSPPAVANSRTSTTCCSRAKVPPMLPIPLSPVWGPRSTHPAAASIGSRRMAGPWRIDNVVASVSARIRPSASRQERRVRFCTAAAPEWPKC